MIVKFNDIANFVSTGTKQELLIKGPYENMEKAEVAYLIARAKLILFPDVSAHYPKPDLIDEKWYGVSEDVLPGEKRPLPVDKDGFIEWDATKRYTLVKNTRSYTKSLFKKDTKAAFDLSVHVIMDWILGVMHCLYIHDKVDHKVIQFENDKWKQYNWWISESQLPFKIHLLKFINSQKKELLEVVKDMETRWTEQEDGAKKIMKSDEEYTNVLNNIRALINSGLDDTTKRPIIKRKLVDTPMTEEFMEKEIGSIKERKSKVLKQAKLPPALEQVDIGGVFDVEKLREAIRNGDATTAIDTFFETQTTQKTLIWLILIGFDEIGVANHYLMNSLVMNVFNTKGFVDNKEYIKIFIKSMCVSKKTNISKYLTNAFSEENKSRAYELGIVSNSLVMSEIVPDYIKIVLSDYDRFWRQHGYAFNPEYKKMWKCVNDEGKQKLITFLFLVLHYFHNKCITDINETSVRFPSDDEVTSSVGKYNEDIRFVNKIYEHMYITQTKNK